MRHLRSVLLFLLSMSLLTLGCSRTTDPANDGRMPAALVSLAQGKAAFVEFYSPT